MSAKLAKRRWETRFLKRIAMPLDHEFYDRVYDLGMVQLNFDTYEELSKYSDCKYIFHCGMSTKGLESRVESLNRVGDLLWVDPTDWDMENQKIDRYAWLNVAADVFLLRLISVHDCLLRLTNDIFETELEPHRCSEKQLKKHGVPSPVIQLLEALRGDHKRLRDERNSRIHQGWERTYSSCDESFRLASDFERRGTVLMSVDSVGRRKKVNIVRYMKEGLVELQRDYNSSLRVLTVRLDQIYDLLNLEFDHRFHSKFHDPKSGFGYQQQTNRSQN